MKNILQLFAILILLSGCDPTPTDNTPVDPNPIDTTTVDTTIINPPILPDLQVGVTVSKTMDHFEKTLWFKSMRFFGDRGDQVTDDLFPWQMTFVGQGGVEKIDYKQDKKTWGMEARVRMLSEQTDFLVYCEEHIWLHELNPDQFAPFFRKQYHLEDWRTLDKLREYCERAWPALDGYIDAYQPYNEYWLGNEDTEEEARANYQLLLRTIVESFEAYRWKKKPILVTPPLPFTPAGTMWDDGFQGDYIPQDLRKYFNAVAFHAYAVRPRQEGDVPPNHQIVWEQDTRLVKKIIDQAHDWMTTYMPGTPLWGTEMGFPNRLNVSTTETPVWLNTEDYGLDHIMEGLDYLASKGGERAFIFEAFEETTNYLYADTYVLALEKDEDDERTITRVMPQGAVVDSIWVRGLNAN